MKYACWFFTTVHLRIIVVMMTTVMALIKSSRVLFLVCFLHRRRLRCRCRLRRRRSANTFELSRKTPEANFFNPHG